MDIMVRNGLTTHAEMGGYIVNRDFDFVTSPIADGLSVIEASAGTGKTYAISHLVPRLLLDGTISNLGEILLVTFTNDAARELAERVRRVLEKLASDPSPDEISLDDGLHRLREYFGTDKVRQTAGRALLDLDLLGVSTIHSFYQKVLQTEGTLCGLPVVPELIPDATDLVDQVVYDMWEKRIASDPILTTLAVAGGWNIKSDLAFIKFALAAPDARFTPDAQPIDEVIGELCDAASQFDPSICDEMRAIWEKVPAWNQCAMNEPDREALLNTLTQSTNTITPEFLNAARQIQSSPDWITARTKESKAIKADAQQSKAVQVATEIGQIIDRTGWNFRINCIYEIRTAVSQALKSNRQITYDGIIESLFHTLQSDHARPLVNRLRSRYHVALIDESQDTDHRQFEIFKKVFVGFDGENPISRHHLILIGDPKQAIYAFRGADVNTYLEAKRLAGHQCYTLTKTFRSPEPLVQATNALFVRPGSLLKDGLTFTNATSGLDGDRKLVVDGQPDDAKIECWIVPDEDGSKYSSSDKRNPLIAATVSSEIVRILNANAKIIQTMSDGSQSERQVLPSDFAVLVSDKHQAAAVADELFNRSVPAIRAGADDIMASDEAAELLAVLRALHEPRRSNLRHAALATRWFGKNSENIRNAEENPESWLETMSAWHAVWLREGIAAALSMIDCEFEFTARIASLDRGERSVTNIRQLTDILETASLELGNQPGRLVRWLAQEISRSGDGRTADERQQQLESDADAVQIVTMHSAKGLQYPLVFCPFLWSAREPRGIEKLSVQGASPRIIDLALADSSYHAAIARSNLEDRLRLAYVAVTRAMVKVWIYGGEVCGTKTPASALDWLLRSDETTDFPSWANSFEPTGRGTQHLHGIKSLAAAAGVCHEIHCKPPTPPEFQHWMQVASVAPEHLIALEAPVIPRPWGLTSFSALTREKHPHAEPDVPFPPHGTTIRKTSFISASTNPFLNAPGGALVGTAVHDWIEPWDFKPPTRSALSTHFSKFPIPESSALFVDQVHGMLDVLREAILPGLGCRMHEACPSAEASEWHFQLPIHDALTARALAQVFFADGQVDYASALAALPVEQLLGYLHGFIDRVAFFHGSWGVIDWKTNHLGSSPADYQPDALRSCAERSHYVLQTHLYLVALRRFLGPEANIAGAWLVFLRGVAAGTDHGILHVQPTSSIMMNLDQLFASPSRV